MQINFGNKSSMINIMNYYEVIQLLVRSIGNLWYVNPQDINLK